ncbi:MAG: exo-alpha-sialidase [Pirellulales bacterium]|nr:exo-alpha-sialidase [Pirellulales bacterium]
MTSPNGPRPIVRAMARREFLVASAAGAAGLLTARAWAATPARRPKLISREVFLKSPAPKTSVAASTFYVRGTGLDKLCVATTGTRSDTADTLRRRFSADNGRTWSDWEAISFITRTPQGVRRVGSGPGWIDPATGRMLSIASDSLLPTDMPKEGLKTRTLRYRVSVDGGRTNAVDRQIIQQGDYTAKHPIEGVWVGRNSMSVGAISCRPIARSDGKLLVPFQSAPVGPDGRYYNPGGGYTYGDAAVLIGTWNDDLSIAWHVSERVVADPARSTRGCLEPTIAQMPDGRILMVLRGSNDRKPKLPGYKWFATSDDGGVHWTKPTPWTYTDGSGFFSPSSCSQLVHHSSGRYYWIGNIVPKNPRGNLPRYPLVIGQIDPRSLLLIRSTIAQIDTRGPDETGDLQLSNFLAYEDRPTGQITLHLTRMFPKNGWRGDAYVYQIEV